MVGIVALCGLRTSVSTFYDIHVISHKPETKLRSAWKGEIRLLTQITAHEEIYFSLLVSCFKMEYVKQKVIATNTDQVPLLKKQPMKLLKKVDVKH